MYPGQLHANQAHGSNMPTSAYIGRQNQQLTSVLKAGHTFSAVPLEQLTSAVQQPGTDLSRIATFPVKQRTGQLTTILSSHLSPAFPQSSPMPIVLMLAIAAAPLPSTFLAYNQDFQDARLTAAARRHRHVFPCCTITCSQVSHANSNLTGQTSPCLTVQMNPNEPHKAPQRFN